MPSRIRETGVAYAAGSPPTVESILEQIRSTREPVILTYKDKPVAAVIPISDYTRVSQPRKKKRPAKRTVTRRAKPETWQEKQERILAKEIAAYEKIKAPLLKTHKGKWVAIHNGQLVDSDHDEQTLTNRVYARFGYCTMLIRQVTETPRVYHVNSPRLKSQ